MGAIEDTRKVLQDFLAPELRALSARLAALEKRFDSRFEQVDKRFEQVDKRLDRIEVKIEDFERRADRRHDEVMGAIRQMIDLNSIQQRFTRLESKESAHQ